jgi:NAD(P)-dependent dehydrogenase (short-subunit alcohol dehydrogenase family)
MDLRLSGKTAVVTGASKGIGLAITAALAAEGVTVWAGARHVTSELADLAAGGQVRPIAVDLAAVDGPARLVAAAGAVDILINNVGGVHPRTGGFLTISDDDWLAALTLNLLAAVRTTRAALPSLVERRGTVVMVNSVNARLADPLVMDYSAAKAALASFVKSLSKEVAPLGVRVNAVSPGPVSTDLWLGNDGVAAVVGHAVGRTPDEVAKQATSSTATGRFTRPDEVADLVLLLASDRAGNMTGSDVLIDGGLVSTT